MNRQIQDCGFRTAMQYSMVDNHRHGRMCYLSLQGVKWKQYVPFNTLMPPCETAWYYIWKEHDRCIHCHENLRSHCIKCPESRL